MNILPAWKCAHGLSSAREVRLPALKRCRTSFFAVLPLGRPLLWAVSCFREPRQGRFTPLRCVPRRLRRWPCGPPLTRPTPARGRSERAARKGGCPRWGGVRSAMWLGGVEGALAGQGTPGRLSGWPPVGGGCRECPAGGRAPRVSGQRVGRRGGQRRGRVPVGWVPVVSGRGLGSVALPVRLARAAPADRSPLRRPGHCSASRGECRCVLREQCRVLRGGEF